MKNLVIAVFICLIFQQTLSSQEATLEKFVNNLEFIVANYPQTKVFVHTDKPYYAIGDDLWYAVYAVNAADHSENPVSEVVYVVMEDEDGLAVSRQSLKLDGKFAHGDIEIGENWEEGIYTLKAYTSYMRNYDENLIFSKEIAIWALNPEGEKKAIQPEQKNQIRFFPEGGYLVNGINGRVAFEITEFETDEIEIFDNEGELVASGKAANDGLGYFNLLPEKGHSYHVEFGGEKVLLPKALTSGYSFNVNNLDDEFTYIEVNATSDLDLAETFVVGHIRGLVYLAQSDMTGQKASFKLEKASLPEGVSQVTLFDKEGQPLIERSIFIRHSEEDLNVNASIPYEYMNTRQKTDVTVKVEAIDDESQEGQYSVSIVDMNQIQGADKGIDIRSYLLMASEFTSGIKDIHEYFGKNSPKTRFLTDMLMLTKAWTRIKWEDVEVRKEPEILYPPEVGFSVSGTVLKGGEPVVADVNLAVLGLGFINVSTKSDEDGYFRILGLDLANDANINISASTLNKRENKVTKGLKIEVNDHLPINVATTNAVEFKLQDDVEIDKFISRANQIQTVDSMFDGMSIQLDEVAISGERKTFQDKRIKEERKIPYSNYDSRIFMDSLAGVVASRSIFDLVRGRVAGVQVVGLTGDQRFKIRGGSNSILGDTDALVLLDGAPISYELVNTLPAESIEFVDVLRGLSSSTIYNSPNGVVALYSKKGANTSPVPSRQEEDHIVNIIHPGYNQSREFYSPDYGKAFAGAEKPDLRTTLYWNPGVKFTKGSSTFSFYTADEATIYLIQIQGLTTSGIPFVHYSSFEVRK